MKENFRILIVEDDLLIAEMLKEMLCDLGYSVDGIAKNFSEANLALEKKQEIDLCFVDINLEDKFSGFDVVKTIKEKFSIPFVFLTSYSDKKTIEEAIALKPEAYLVKPFSQTDLFTTVEIIRTRSKNNAAKPNSSNFVFKDGTLTVKLDTSEILWLKSDNNYVELKTAEKLYVIRNSLERMLEELKDPSFVRAHRSFVVNINHVNAVNGQFLVIASEKIPLSRSFRDEFHQHFKS